MRFKAHFGRSICILSVLMFMTGAVAGQSAVLRTLSDECGAVSETTLVTVRYNVVDVFLDAPPNFFTQPKLSGLFACIRESVPKNNLLKVTLFSDPENLKVAIRNHLFPDYLFEGNANPNNWDCKNPSLGKLPCPKGYFRAIYFNFEGREYFDYSADPDQVPLTRVYIGKPDSTFETLVDPR